MAVRNDPTDNGGLFIGRRPGTRPVRYRALPQRGSAVRQGLDRTFAVVLLIMMVVINLLFWGPLPVAWLWVGAHIDYYTGDVSVGILSAFVGMLLTLVLGLVLLRRLDQAWILVRRAAGNDQRGGVMARIFVVTCGLGTVAFAIWFFVFSGAQVIPLASGS